MRKLLAAGALLSLLLVACNANTGASPTMTPLPVASPSALIDIPPSTLASPSESMASPSETTMAMSCTEAFQNLSTTDIATVTSLSDAQSILDSTIQACQTLDEWQTAAQSVIPTLDVSGAQDFIRQRCQESTTLAGSQLCMDVGA